MGRRIAQGGTITYDYRGDGLFTIEVQRAERPVNMDGTWCIIGIGAESMGIQRDGKVPPNEFFQPGDRVLILFPAPNHMTHTVNQTSIDFVREGSGEKPGQLPPPNERQKAVIALERLGADVLRDPGFDGLVSSVQFQGKNASDADLMLLKPLPS